MGYLDDKLLLCTEASLASGASVTRHLGDIIDLGPSWDNVFRSTSPVGGNTRLWCHITCTTTMTDAAGFSNSAFWLVAAATDTSGSLEGGANTAVIGASEPIGGAAVAAATPIRPLLQAGDETLFAVNPLMQEIRHLRYIGLVQGIVSTGIGVTGGAVTARLVTEIPTSFRQTLDFPSAIPG